MESIRIISLYIAQGFEHSIFIARQCDALGAVFARYRHSLPQIGPHLVRAEANNGHGSRPQTRRFFHGQATIVGHSNGYSGINGSRCISRRDLPA